MNYKEQLKQQIRLFNELKEQVKTKIESIRQDRQYSEEYKHELIQKETADCKAKQEEIAAEAIRIIQAAKQSILAEKTQVEKNGDFELSLSNALRFLDMLKENISTEDLKHLVNPFKGDYATMQLLESVCRNYNIKNVDEVFPHNVIEQRIALWEEIERFVNPAFTRDILEANTMPLTIALDMKQIGGGTL